MSATNFGYYVSILMKGSHDLLSKGKIKKPQIRGFFYCCMRRANAYASAFFWSNFFFIP